MVEARARPRACESVTCDLKDRAQGLPNDEMVIADRVVAIADRVERLLF